MELRNVTRYYPEDMPYGEGIQYFRSEDGQDFYESLDKFTKKYKLCTHPETGVIYSMAEDVSGFIRQASPLWKWMNYRMAFVLKRAGIIKTVKYCRSLLTTGSRQSRSVHVLLRLPNGKYPIRRWICCWEYSVMRKKKY